MQNVYIRYKYKGRTVNIGSTESMTNTYASGSKLNTIISFMKNARVECEKKKVNVRSSTLNPYLRRPYQ